MTDKAREFISRTLKKESDSWVAIAQEKAKQHPNDSLRQIMIRTMIQHWESHYPDFMVEFDHEIKKKKELAKNQYAANEVTDMRQVSAIPDGLETRINKTFEQKGWTRFLSKEAQKEFKELDWFLKEFPRYQVPLVY